MVNLNEMSEDTFEAWVFQNFISSTPELDFSEVLDWEEDVAARVARVSEIPPARRVDVLDTVVLDNPCPYVVDELQVMIDRFDTSFISQTIDTVRSGNVKSLLQSQADVPCAATMSKANQDCRNVAGPSGVAHRTSNVPKSINTNDDWRNVAGPSGIQSKIPKAPKSTIPNGDWRNVAGPSGIRRATPTTTVQSGKGGVQSAASQVQNPKRVQGSLVCKKVEDQCVVSDTSGGGRPTLTLVPSNGVGPSQNGISAHNGGGRVHSDTHRRRKPLFTVVADAIRTYKNYNMQGTYYMLNITKPLRSDSPELWLGALLAEVINYFKSHSTIVVRPGDYIGLQLSNPCYAAKPVFVGLRRSDQMDAAVVLERIMSIFDSNQDFFLNGFMEVEFNHIQMPHGSAVNRIKKPLGQSNTEFIQGRVSFIKYMNPRKLYPNDEYCLPYALILAKAALLVDKTQLRSLKRSVSMLRAEAEKLCAEAGVTIRSGGCSIEEVKKFQAVMRGYQIIVYTSLEPKHVPYTDLDYIQPLNRLNIFLNDGHYTAMRTLKACLASTYVCPDCSARAKTRLKHRNCFYTCPCCLARPPCALTVDEATIECPDCYRSFRGRECFKNHIAIEGNNKFSACQRVKRCPDCDVVYYVDADSKHECHEFYCTTCESKQGYEHRCHMPRYETNRDSGSNILYVIYDFETQQNTLLEPERPAVRNKPPVPAKYKHVPNLCVLQTFCNSCRDVPNISTQCDDCGVRQRILFSEDCVGDLLDIITYKANERKPVEDEPVEETLDGGPAKKKRKRVGGHKFKKVVAISHNMGGFDGQFILSHILQSGRYPTPKIIMNGTRLIQMNIGYSITFLDSLNYFHTALSKLPAMFGFEGSKGYYPHLFNTPENKGKVVGRVDRKYYCPESMTVKGRVEFNEWYDSLPEDYEFDNDSELIRYCVQDVDILRKACIKFSNEFWEMNHIDPFLDACTMAGACNKVFRSNYLKPETIGVMPTGGYRYRDNQSKIALQWLSLVELDEGIEITHAARGAERRLPGVGKVDGFHEATNRVFEFLGCYWHGCEICFPNLYQPLNFKQPCQAEDADEPYYIKPNNPNNENDERNQDMFIRREKTARKCRKIIEEGYELVVMRECEFRRHLWNHPEAAQIVKKLPILINSPLDPRDAFYGGRTDANKLYFKSDGITKMHYYDICSLYPFINKTAKCPVRHPTVHIGDVCDTLPWQDMDGLMKVTVSPPRNLAFPVLPARMHSKLLFFLCSTCAETLNKCQCTHTDTERVFTGTWVIDEVKLAMRHKYKIVKIHEIWEYEVTQYDPVTKTGGFFVGYINRFLKIKAEASGWPKTCKTEEEKDAFISDFYEREGILLEKSKMVYNAAQRQMAKDQLNSFWGRFGLRPDLMRTIIVDSYDQLVMKMLDPKIDMNCVTPVNDNAVLLNYREQEEARRPNSSCSVAIAAFTTAYARIELYKYLEALGTDRIYYYDTDSIFFTSKPGDVMPIKGDFLGMMTDELEKYGEGTYIDEFVSGGPKNYAYTTVTPGSTSVKTVIKVKGVTLNDETAKIINFDLIKKYVTDPTPSIDREPGVDKEDDAVELYYNSIRRTCSADVYTTRVKKTYRVNYTKRQMTEDFGTIPYGF